MNLTIYLFLILLTCILLFALLIILKIQRDASNLKKHGIPYLGGGLNRFLRVIKKSMSLVEMEEEIYNDAKKCKTPIVGVSDFSGSTNLLITDLDLVKAIAVKDFDHFINRRPLSAQQSNKFIGKMLVFMQNEHWKYIRTKVSPAFTTSKIRKMFQIFGESSEKLENYLKEQMDYPSRKSVDMDFIQMFSKYALDVIACCAFGVDSKSFEVAPDQKSTFEQMAKKFGFQLSAKLMMKFVLLLSVPKVANFFGVDAMDWESQEYFSKVIKEVLRRRRETGERREDFIQLLMDAQEGRLKGDEEGGPSSEESTLMKEGSKKWAFDDNDLIANVLVFLIGGYDTTMSAMLFVLYALALEPDVQEKLSQEVKSALGKTGGKVTYEAVSGMSYLDMVVNETIRRYTPSTRTERVCNKDYPVPGTSFVIEKDSVVIFPTFGFHHDHSYFPDPNKFNPERFSSENKASRHPYAFMPFGHGPRNCIAMRFSLAEVKAVIAQLVHKFHFAPCSKTKIPMEYDNNVTTKPKGNMWLNVTVRDN